jgi:hypothetical protein
VGLLLPESEFKVAEVDVSAATTGNAAEDHVDEVTQIFRCLAV